MESSNLPDTLNTLSYFLIDNLDSHDKPFAANSQVIILVSWSRYRPTGLHVYERS